ncbi:hypothetical protein DFH27DRAFT_558703 [Peziza echinospora]|nr:hypothetical protein DFH27DRAFT_558703 [Peziza echinospora]
MHWTAAAVHLGATLAMTAVRAWVRADYKGRQTPFAHKIPTDFELDWLAMRLAMCSSQFASHRDGDDASGGGGGLGIHSNGVVSEAYTAARESTVTEGSSGGMEYLWDKMIVAQEERRHGQKKRLQKEKCTNPYQQARHRRSQHEGFSGKPESEQAMESDFTPDIFWGQSGIGWSIDQLITNDMRAEERKLAALPVKSAISQDVFIAIRKRLGVLTEWGNPRVADVSMELSKAIEIVLNTLDPHGKKSEGDADGTHKTESTETSQSTQFSSIWPLEVTILGIPTKLNLYVRFDKEKKRWLVKKKGTEAILSLWYFSLQHTQRYGKETEQFFVFGPADARSLRDLQWWAADSVCPVLEVTTKKSKVIQTGKVQTTLEIDAKPGKWEASARKYGSKIFEEPELDNRLKQSQFFSQRSALKKKRQKLSQIQDHVDAETSCANEAPGILTGLEADSLQIGEMSRVRSPVRVDISKVEKTAFFGFTGDSHTSAEKLAKTPLEFYQPEVSSIVRFGPKKLSSSSIYEQLGNDPNSMRMKPEPKASEFLCFNLAESASTADNARLLVLPRHTSMLRMCSMHMFWAFLVAAAGRMGLDLVEGALEKTSLQGDPVSTSSILPGGNGVWVVMGRPRLHNALLSDLAKNIAAAGVCNRDEAHQLIVLALSAHKRLPLDPVIRWVQARVRIYLREHRVGEASRMSVWLWQVCSTCGWTTEASVDALAMVVACSVVAKSQDNKSLLRRPLSLASHGTIHDGSLVWLGQGTVLRHVWEAGGMGKDEVAFMESCQEIILAECRADDTGRRACFVRDLSLACTFGRWLDGIGTVGDGWLSTIAQIATKTSTRPVSTGTRHSQGQKIRPTYDRAEKYVTGAYWGWGWFFNISKQAPERVTVFDKELPNASALYKGDFLGRNILHHVAMHISKDDNTSLSLRHRLSRKPPPGWDRLKGPFTVSIALASPDVFGLTPLHLAAAVGNSWAVTFFLDESPNASAIDCFGRTPLHLAAGAQPVNPYIIKLLARAAPTSVTATDVYGELPLHYYISSNSSTQSEGVDKTSGHETADGSCEAGSYEPSSETGKSLDAKGGACHCESEVLGCLIKRTGMPQKDAYIAFKTRDSAASTLVHHAAIAGNITAITELRNIAHRETVVDCSECCRVRGHCKKAQVIVQALSSSNTKPFASEEDHGYGVTPLFVAVNHGQGPFISFLLKTGSDFIISGSLDPNLRFGIYSVQLLLELLDSAIDSGFESVCELLLDDHNDSLRIEDLWDGGYHILCRAISHERPSIVKIVLRFLKDYNVNSRPHQWSPSAMDEAQLRHNAPIIDLLTEHATKIGTVVAEPRKVASDLYEKSPYDRDSIEPDHLSIKTADLAYSSSGELESGVEDEHDPRSLINSDNEMHPDSEEDEHDDGSNNINGMNGINNNSNDNAT